jgi:hypothetical protein
MTTFENVNRQAVLDHRTAMNLDKPHAVLQIVSMRMLPQPVFPLADVYFAESYAAMARLRELHPHKVDSISFADLDTYLDPGESEKSLVVFMSQPRDFETNADIVFAMDDVCSEAGSPVAFRLHPRDNMRNYSALARDRLRSMKAEESLEELLDSAALVVSKSSSVLMEAIERGVPIIACPFTEADRSSNAPFLQPIEGVDFLAEDIDDLRRLLRQPFSVHRENSHNLREYFFSTRGLSDVSLMEWVCAKSPSLRNSANSREAHGH